MRALTAQRAPNSKGKAVLAQPVREFSRTSVAGLPAGYAAFLEELKGRIRVAQIRASLSVNRELIRLYWSIGPDTLQRQRN